MKQIIPKALASGSSGNMQDAINNLITNKIREIDTASIGIIEKFDPVTQTATIQIAIDRVIQTETADSIIIETESNPLLVNVPVMFPGGGDWFLTFPVKKGDECLLIASQRSIDNWKSNGGVQEPSNVRRYLSIKDAVAIVGLNSKASALTSFNGSEPELRNRAGNIKMTFSDTGINVKGNLSVEGSVTAYSTAPPLVVSLGTHVHTAHGVAPTPIPPL